MPSIVWEEEFGQPVSCPFVTCSALLAGLNLKLRSLGGTFQHVPLGLEALTMSSLESPTEMRLDGLPSEPPVTGDSGRPSSRLGAGAMKAIFCVLCLLTAIAAHGQEASGNSGRTTSSRPHHIQSASHAKRANSGSTSAHSEMPQRKAMSTNAEVPLGDTARTLKKKHASAKKARKVFEN